MTELRPEESDLLLQSAILRNMAEAVCLVRAGDATIIYANPKFERMFGYNAGELNGKPLTTVNAGADATEAEETARKIIAELKEKGEAIYEVQNLKKDGTPFWCRAHTSTLEHPEYGTVWVAVHEDITELKKAMETEIIKESAEAASKAKSDFLANMSHELRTPLNAIIGFSEIMLEGLTGELTGQQRDYIAQIHESGNHLLTLIDDILDLSKIEAGRIELNFDQFPVRDLINSSLGLFKEKALKHGLKIIVEMDEDLDTLTADMRLLKQVLVNLVGNAVKFTPDGGSIIVKTRKTAPDFVEFSISDTGIGISREDQEKLFQPFRQLDSSYDRKYAGTGLGLSICKQIVEMHGGKIWLESEVGRGSKFTFVIPSGLEAGG